MYRRTSLHDVTKSVFGRYGNIVRLLSVAVVLLSVVPAHAQLTAARLLESSVEKYDSKYDDVEKAITSFKKGINLLLFMVVDPQPKEKDSRREFMI